MARLRVGVLRGGPSSEYEVSLKTGGSVLEHLPAERYEPRDIFIDRAGVWHVRGFPMEPERALRQLDVVFNALHGSYGEDGSVQRLLEHHGMLFTGSDAIASALSMNKLAAKERAAALGARVALHRVIRRDEMSDASLLTLFQTFPQPCVIKPIRGGSSVGVAVARSYDQLVRGLRDALQDAEEVLLEEYISGTEATCAVVNNFRGQEVYVLPEIEIVPNPENQFFDYAAKYDGQSQEICPGRFPRAVKDELSELASRLHAGMGMRHYSRSDFIVSPRGVYFLEINSLPGLTPASLVPKALDAVGCSFPQFLDHLIHEALRR